VVEVLEGILQHIPTESILPNPYNPRIVFDSPSLESLKKSIEEVGILVPITVYQRKSEDKYVLIDGERRWRCAKEIGLPHMPAYILPEPDPSTELMQTFSIHHLKSEPHWEPIYKALKLETLMRTLSTQDPAKLSVITGMSTKEVERCQRILYFSKKYQNILLTDKKDFPAEFFIELYPLLITMDRDFSEIYKKKNQDEIIHTFLELFIAGQIYNVRQFRDLNKMFGLVKSGSIEKERAIRLFFMYLEEPEQAIRHIIEEVYPKPSRQTEVQKLCKNIASLLLRISQEQMLDEELVTRLQELKLELNKGSDKKAKKTLRK
jgi:ParB family transcriptional regulator, chromosome partitioning protein